MRQRIWGIFGMALIAMAGCTLEEPFERKLCGITEGVGTGIGMSYIALKNGETCRREGDCGALEKCHERFGDRWSRCRLCTNL